MTVINVQNVVMMHRISIRLFHQMNLFHFSPPELELPWFTRCDLDDIEIGLPCLSIELLSAMLKVELDLGLLGSLSRLSPLALDMLLNNQERGHNTL